MTFLLIAAVVAAMILLYVTDRVLKALARGRRYRLMGERLNAAAARSEAEHEQRETAAAVSTELTSVMPAINRPPLTLPGVTSPRHDATADSEAKPDTEAEPDSDAQADSEAALNSDAQADSEAALNSDAQPDSEAQAVREASPSREHRPARPREKQGRAGERAARAGDMQAHGGEGTAHLRLRSAERSGRAGRGSGPRQPRPR
jgi:hypothetical protein